MKKYYYNDYLIRTSNRDYSYAVCSVNEADKKVIVYSCHSSLELAKVSLKRESERIGYALQSWKKVLDAPEEWLSIASIEVAKAYYDITKKNLDNLRIVKIEAR